MAEGRNRAQWAQTAEVLALIANVNRDPKKHPEPFRAVDINPYARKGSKPKPKAVSMSELRAMIPELPSMLAGARRVKPNG